VDALFGSEDMGDNMERVGGEASGLPIFISYRRVDRAAFADPFFERLTDWFGPDAVFLDRKNIELGAKFPDELDRAVRAAKVVLVLITTQWGPEFDKRLKEPAAGIDYVRQEVALALSLPGCVVIPVYWDCQPGLKTALPEDVRDIIDRNSVLEDGPLRLEGSADSWGASYLALRAHIEAKAGIKPVPACPDQEFWNSTRSRIKKLLESDGMKPLVTLWGDEPLGSVDARQVTATTITDHLLNFTKAIRKAVAEVQKEPGSPAVQESRRQCCAEILSALCRLLVDRRSARHWTRPLEASGPVPVHYAGTSALVHAVLNDWPLVLQLDVDDQAGFRPIRTAVLEEVDPGAGKDRVSQAQRAVWKVAKTRDFPRGENLPLDGEELKAFQADLSISAMLDEPYLLTGVVNSAPAAHRDLVKLGDGLGVAAVGRVGLSGVAFNSVLHIDEHQLNALVKACLKSIKELP
jgi:hypothetical protein